MIVILDETSYISAIEETLNDYSKFSNLDIPAGKEVDYITNLEERITSDLKLLKTEKVIDKAAYENIKPVGSKPGFLCRFRLTTVYKETKNGLQSLCPILSANGTSNYQIAKLLLPFLTP